LIKNVSATFQLVDNGKLNYSSMFCKNSTILASCFAVALSMFCSASRFARGFSDRIITNTGACAITISLTSTSKFEVGSYSPLLVYTYSYKNHGKYSSKMQKTQRKPTRIFFTINFANVEEKDKSQHDQE